MLNFLKTKRKTPEQKFWNWILKHKSALEAFIFSDHQDLTVYNQLTEEMKKYNSLLFPEMTLSSEDEIVLIITPDGMHEGVEPTQKLFNSKPQLDNWIVKKFRQPSDDIQLNFNGVEFPSSDIKIIAELNEKTEKVDIQVFVKNMNSDKEKYQTLAWLYLDHILGEFNTITRVGYVDFYHLEEDQRVDKTISILELRKLIEHKLY